MPNNGTCLSEEDTRRAWEMERRGQGRILTAMEFYVAPNTLYRAYQYYGLPNPKRGKYRPRKKKDDKNISGKAE